MIAINGEDTLKLLVSEMEVHGGQNLTELFGRHFLMVVTIPVLEEGLEVQSSGDTEVSETHQEVLYDFLLLFGFVLEAVMVVQIVG